MGTYFTEFWWLGSPRSRHLDIQCLLEGLLPHRWLPSHCTPQWWKGQMSFLEPLLQTNSILEGASFMLNHFPKALPLNAITLGVRIWEHSHSVPYNKQVIYIHYIQAHTQPDKSE
jgi:hypothetical protein